MHTPARVLSIDSLRDFRAQLCDFALSARQALGATEQELNRTYDWLEQQRKHWQKVIRACEEEVARAKAELVQRKFAKADRRGWTEPELVLKKAQAKLEMAQTKLERTRYWILHLPQAIHEYEGPARQLAGILDADLARALALLERRIEALDAYLRTTVPEKSS